MIYLLIVNVSLTISFMLYWLIFRKLTFFQWNRMYLIGMLFFSLLAPIGIFIELPDSEMVEYRIPMVDLDGYLHNAINGSKTQPVYLLEILTYVYWMGVGMSCVWLLIRIVCVLRELRDGQGYHSFSFFNRIIIGHALAHHKSIERHELVHVEQGHSYDLLLLELLKIFNWFNPILYFFQKELKFQHECIADEICSSDKVAYAELLVAHALRTNQLPLRHEFSNQSFLKKRIMMLFKNRSAGKHKLLYIAILPMVLVIAGSTLILNTSRAKGLVSDVESSINQVEVPVVTQATAGFEGTEAAAGSIARKLDGALDNVKSSLKDKIAKRGPVDKPAQHDTIAADPIIFTQLEVIPEPIGGMKEFMIWISNNYDYPKAALERGVKGIIEISFIVEKDGSLSHVKVRKDLGYGTGKAALRLIRSASKWRPGMQNGRKVRVAYTLPIRLNLVQEKDK